MPRGGVFCFLAITFMRSSLKTLLHALKCEMEYFRGARSTSILIMWQKSGNIARIAKARSRVLSRLSFSSWGRGIIGGRGYGGVWGGGGQRGKPFFFFSVKKREAKKGKKEPKKVKKYIFIFIFSFIFNFIFIFNFSVCRYFCRGKLFSKTPCGSERLKSRFYFWNLLFSSKIALFDCIMFHFQNTE